MTQTSKPLYQHDCPRCVFLGTYEKHDLYFCGHQMVGGATVIARYSSEGPNYTSGIETAAGLSEEHLSEVYEKEPSIAALRVAYLIAQDRGFIKAKTFPLTKGEALNVLHFYSQFIRHGGPLFYARFIKRLEKFTEVKFTDA